MPGLVFLHIYFGDNLQSESSRISLEDCNTVDELFSRMQAQVPDTLEAKVIHKIKVQLGQPTKTFKIPRNGKREFDAWMNLLGEEGDQAGLKPIGYAQMLSGKDL